MSERSQRSRIWAIFRHETWGDRDLSQRVTGTKAYRDRNRAEEEVRRLNAASVTAGRGPQYFVSLVRLVEDSADDEMSPTPATAPTWRSAETDTQPSPERRRTPELSPEQQVELQRLTELFERIGVSDPESWARSEVVESIPQAARAMFLRMAWRYAIEPFRDPKWLREEVELFRQDPGAPFADLGRLIERMRDNEIEDSDIATFARGVAAAAVFQLLYSMGDYENVAGAPGWRLMETDAETGELTGRPVDGLHESVLETDPSGREMRPIEFDGPSVIAPIQRLCPKVRLAERA